VTSRGKGRDDIRRGLLGAQRDGGIDPGRGASGNEAGQHGNGGDQQADEREGGRIAQPDGGEEELEEAAETERGRDPENET
jgi:hypothetical protein